MDDRSHQNRRPSSTRGSSRERKPSNQVARGRIDRGDHLVGPGLDVVELDVLGALERLGQRHVHALIAVGGDDLGHGLAGEQLEPLLRRDLLRRTEVRDQQESAEEQHADQSDVDQRIAGELLHIHGRISVSPPC